MHVMEYLRTLNSKKAVMDTLRDDKDFVITDISDKYCDKPVNLSQMKGLGLTEVTVRYANKRKQTIIKFKDL